MLSSHVTTGKNTFLATKNPFLPDMNLQTLLFFQRFVVLTQRSCQDQFLQISRTLCYLVRWSIFYVSVQKYIKTIGWSHRTTWEKKLCRTECRTNKLNQISSECGIEPIPHSPPGEILTSYPTTACGLRCCFQTPCSISIAKTQQIIPCLPHFLSLNEHSSRPDEL